MLDAIVQWSVEMVQQKLTEERRSVDAKLAALEERLWQLATGPASHQGEIATHDDEAKRGVTISAIDEVLSTRRVEAREWVMEQIEQARHNFEARLAEVEQRCKAVPGKLPPVKTWREGGVIYESEIATQDGALWQARCDTGQRPGGSDWVCVARAGRDAITPIVCGNFDAHESYAELDIVSYDGGAYIARHNNPGIPGHGDGWQPLSQRGRRGAKGESVVGPRAEQGAKGDKGDSALEIVSWHIDGERYRAIPFMSNGQMEPALELRALFERYLIETGGQP